MDELEIAFDTKEKFEYFIKYVFLEYKGELLKDYEKKYYILKKQELVPSNIGTFLLTFLNINFNDFNKFKKFTLEYLFMHLFFKMNPHALISSLILDENFNIILSKKEINLNLNKMYKLYKDEFIKYQNIYIAIANHKYFESYSNWNNKICESYNNYLSYISPTILNLKINYSIAKFKELYNYKNIKYSYCSTEFHELLYISFQNLLLANKNMQIMKCANCNNYFIPDTNHNTKYCNFLFAGNKTCKEIGNNNEYLKKLEQNRLLKKYRNRYQSLAKQASTTTPDSRSNKMYEYYKKEGKKVKQNYINGIITDEEFERWIDSTKIRK